MGVLDFDPDSAEISDGGSFVVLPHSIYRLQCIEAELKNNSKNTGQVIALKIEVVSGEYAGASFPTSINFTHSNPVAQRIGQGELKALGIAIQHEGRIAETDDLLWKEFDAEVVIEPYTKRDGTQGESNKLGKFYVGETPIDSSFNNGGSAPPAGKPAATPAARPSTPPARPSSPPGRPAAAGSPSVPWRR